MRIAPLALALLVALGVPAEAASRHTARASGTIPLRAGPGSDYRIIDQLPDGSQVRLEQCTCESKWCLVLLEGEVAGWARGSYLVGSAAKLEVTPMKLLVDPFPHRRHGLFEDDEDDDAFIDTVTWHR